MGPSLLGTDKRIEPGTKMMQRSYFSEYFFSVAQLCAMSTFPSKRFSNSGSNASGSGDCAKRSRNCVCRPGVCGFMGREASILDNFPIELTHPHPLIERNESDLPRLIGVATYHPCCLKIERDKRCLFQPHGLAHKERYWLLDRIDDPTQEPSAIRSINQTVIIGE